MPHAAYRANISRSILRSAETIRRLEKQRLLIEKIGRLLIATLRRGNKVMTAGNGGSAAEALHMAEELVGRFLFNRPSLPAVALVADPTALTCIANDFGYDEVFRRQVEGLGRPGDLIVIFSTSGNAENLLRAADAARHRRIKVVSFLGRDGGRLAGMSDLELIVPSDETARIQEAHQVLIHLLLEMVEEAFPAKTEAGANPSRHPRGKTPADQRRRR